MDLARIKGLSHFSQASYDDRILFYGGQRGSFVDASLSSSSE
jgi:hypothetical protein